MMNLFRINRRTTGPGVYIARHTRFDCGEVVIGAYTRINGPAVFKGLTPITIGKFCAIGEEFTVISKNHDLRYANLQVWLQNKLGGPTLYADHGPVIIGNNVWIGDRVIVLPGALIGDGAVVAAGSVVSGRIPPFCIAAGVPARVIRTRFTEEVTAGLLSIKWWDWPLDRIRKNKELFSSDLSLITAEDLIRIVK